TRGSPRTSSSRPEPSVPSCSKPSRTSPCGWRYAPSLTASARAGHVIPCGSGRGNGLSRSNKETDVEKYRKTPRGTPLTKSAPYKLSERNVEQARSACNQFMDTMAQATSLWLSAMPPNETTSGLKAIHERAARFAKQNAEACFTFANELANARDMQEVLGMQG